jgi:hypothetical protein
MAQLSYWVLCCVSGLEGFGEAMKLKYRVEIRHGHGDEAKAYQLLTEKTRKRYPSAHISMASYIDFATIRRALAFMRDARRQGAELELYCLERRNKHGHCKVFVLRAG